MQCCSDEEDIVDAEAELSETSLAPADTTMKENSNSMKENLDADCAKKTVKIQCLVERIMKRTDGESTFEHRTEKDVEVTLPSDELFADVVQLVLEKLGYPNTEALGAKGFIEINKNWNLVPLDSATINKTATVGKMLGDVSGFAVIRIQLSNSSKVSALYEIQHNLLSYLLEKSHDLLQDAGCPLDQMALKQLTSGTFKEVLPDDMTIAFDRWYQTNREFGVPARRSSDSLDFTQHSSDDRRIGRSCRPEERPISELMSSRLALLLNKDTEISKLEQWYSQNKFPSKAVMIDYLNELNSQELRRSQKPPLELADVVDWFANRRNDEMITEKKMASAEMSEKSPSLPCASDNANIHHSRNTLKDVKINGYPSKSSDEIMPVFANKNAVFCINPHRLSRHDSVGLEVLRENDKFNQEIEHCSTPSNKSLNFSESFMKRSRGQKRSSDENHNRFDLLTTNSQNEATDLSLRRPYDNASPQTDKKPSGVQLFLQDSSSISQKRPRTLKSEKLNRSNMESFLRSGSPSTFKSNVDPGPHSPFSLHNVQKAQQMQMAAAYLQLQYMQQHSALFNPSYPSLPAFAPQGRVDEPALGNGRGGERVKRSRIFIDPVTEIPKLEEWFRQDSRPSSHILEHYTKVLNSMPYRQQRTIILDTKNIQLWFKNHRAKIRNQSLQKERTSPPSSGHSDGINSFVVSPSLSKYSETFKQENDDDFSDNSDGAPDSANSDGPTPCLEI